MSARSSSSHLSADKSEFRAVEELVALLLDDETLNTLYSAALHSPKIGPERFERNFGRLLSLHSIDLREAAQTPLHREAAHFVQSRARYVANSIRKTCGPDDQHDTRLNLFEELGRLIHVWNDPSAVLPNRDEARDFGGEEFDGSDTIENDMSVLQSLANVKEFMVSGDAFRNLQQSLKDFVHPPSGKGVNIGPSADGKHTSTNTHIAISLVQGPSSEGIAEEKSVLLEESQYDFPDYLSLSSPTILIDHGRSVRFTPSALFASPGLVDQAKRMVEVSLRCPIIWWPLQPRREACPKDYIRVSWDCVNAHPSMT
jgi:hypothetical protein